MPYEIKKLNRTAAVLGLVVVAAACGGDSTGPDLGACQAAIDLFPVPVDDATTLFDEVDDGELEVDFDPAFSFSFYGMSYSSVFLNTNGGMTFGAGNSDYHPTAADIMEPGIGVFWADLNAGETTASTARANQMTYQVCEDRFIVSYQQLQDYDVDAQNNSATVTLYASGQIVIEYGTVLSDELLVGVWDGSHADDRFPGVATSYSNYSTTGTGTIALDYYDTANEGTANTGQLNNQTVTFNP